MNFVCIGKLINTHGIKGEVRIISNFKYKNIVFKKGNSIIIDKISYEIVSYRKHKNYDMLMLLGINSINEAELLKDKLVYIDRNLYDFDYLDEDLIGFKVYDKDIYKGTVKKILKTNLYSLLEVDGKRKHFIPNNSYFIDKIDLKNKKIQVNYIKGLDNED